MKRAFSKEDIGGVLQLSAVERQDLRISSPPQTNASFLENYYFIVTFSSMCHHLAIEITLAWYP